MANPQKIGLQELPDVDSNKYPRTISIRVSEEHYQKAQAMKAKRKDVSKYLRPHVESALDGVEIK
jgi:hypothetical protein